ncbi:putative F-box domain-containing protein [Tanacetum coccineum]
MSDVIPFDIQSEIMKRLPVKSLIQFRSVSKQWKSFIDSPKFIKNYHVNHTNPQHHLLVKYNLDLKKVNDSLGLLEYYLEGEASVCGVWTRKDGANELFTKIYTVKVEGKSLYGRVLGFRNNGDVVTEVVDDDHLGDSEIEVYEPSSGHINGVGINGKRGTFTVRSYMETLLLLDESDSIIH